MRDAAAVIPTDRKECRLTLGRRTVRLTNLDKTYWPADGITKGDLLRYYLSIADPLLPHLKSRAMVMKRYPHGIDADHFFMKRTPSHAPDWLTTCSIEHASGNVIDALEPGLVTAEYRIEKRPPSRVLVDYNQNAWGRTLASVYSVRPRPRAPVSMPVTWEEVEEGIEIDDFRIDNAPQRVAERGDLWAPLLERKGRFPLERLLA